LVISHHIISQILEEQQELAFHLQQQRLIELIREGRVDDALEFAQENLAPLGEEHPALLEELGAHDEPHSKPDFDPDPYMWVDAHSTFVRRQSHCQAV
jgi:hypothetical protein